MLVRALILLLFCNTALAYTEQDDKWVSDIVKACRNPKNYYNDNECFEVLNSRVDIEIPELALCYHLPYLNGCVGE